MSAQTNGDNNNGKEKGLLGSNLLDLILAVLFMAALAVVGFFVGQLVGTTQFSTLSQSSGGLAITATLLQKMGFKTAAAVYNGTAIQAFAQSNTAVSTDEEAFSAMFALLGGLAMFAIFTNRHRNNISE